MLWDGYRRRLEADRDAEAVTYSLWVDWFEDHDTAATAFAEVLGNDIDHVVAQGSDDLLRRAGRVLACSGPVPWLVKQKAYVVAVQLLDLHMPLFKGLLACYHDVYGDLEPTAALALLARLQLRGHPPSPGPPVRARRRAREPLPQPPGLGRRGGGLSGLIGLNPVVLGWVRAGAGRISSAAQDGASSVGYEVDWLARPASVCSLRARSAGW